MSYTFSVTHNNLTKKVSCPTSSTVNKLVSISIEKFKLPTTTNACLSYKGKKLDGMLSLRLANLINNAKLDLIMIELTDSVNLRVNGMCLNHQLSKIIRVSPTISLASLVSRFLQECGVDIDWRNHNVKLSAMQNGIDNKSSDFDAVTVGSLVGTSSSASLRLVIEDAADAKRVQEAQLEQQKLRARLEQEKAEARLNAAKISKDMETPLNNQDVTTTDSAGTPEEDKNAKDTYKTPENKMESSPNTIDAVNELLTAPQPVYEPEILSGEQATSWLPSREIQDTLYNPRGQIDLYENPNEDYNVTTHHAETYLKSLQAMQRPSKKHLHIQPSRYTIRVRFPDRKFLDLVMEDSSAALGQLFKKLDSYVHPNFINSYVLRNGCPPFNEIEMGFSQNNTPLKDHPQFQDERVLLVWETVAKLTSGPYLKEDLLAKDITEMPTVALESNRNNLQGEEPTARAKTVHATVNKATDKKKPGIPKWFRP